MPVITALTYRILLALADEDRHGYGILKEIEDREGPGAAPTTGAMYLALQRMEKQGLIEESPSRPAETDDSRRRYYRITRVGRQTAEAESVRLAALVEAARAKKLLAGGRA